MAKRFILLSLSVSALLGNIAEYNFYYQDYMDFGQNKGRFTPGTTNITIKNKDGKTYVFGDLPMPDFVGPTDTNGIMTFVGGGGAIFLLRHIQ